MQNDSAIAFLKESFVSPDAKILAWFFLLLFFFENGTLGLIPKQLYFVYRNVRISDLIIYGLIGYALINAKEYYTYYKSSLLLIIKILAIFLILEFVISFYSYNFNFIEYFFRLKALWGSFLIFPFLLLIKRNGVKYLIKLMFPISVISNMLYILTSLTGIKFLPDVSISLQSLPGGLEVYRVYGGTFWGEFFFLGIIFFWVTNKFKLYQLIPVILFAMPHILAFGRGTWLRILFDILLIFIWNIYRKKNFKTFIRQTVIAVVMALAVVYSFERFIPESARFSDALEARVEQGKDDYINEKGTYGTRLANVKSLVELWSKNNLLFGIGMHPMWVVAPATMEETIYVWGFSDIAWASVLAAYGLVGLILALLFQIRFLYSTARVLIKDKRNDMYAFFCLIFLATLIFSSFFNYDYTLTTFSLNGITITTAFFVAATVYKNEQLKTESAKQENS